MLYWLNILKGLFALSCVALWFHVCDKDHQNENFHAKNTRKSHLKSTQWSQGDNLELDPWVNLTNIQSNGNLYICVWDSICVYCVYIYIYIYLYIDQLILWFLANDNHHNKPLRPEAWTWDEHVGRVAEERSWENHRIIQRMHCWYRKIRAILHLYADTQYQYSIPHCTCIVFWLDVFFSRWYTLFLFVEPATFASRAWIANVLEPQWTFPISGQNILNHVKTTT